AYDTVDWNFLRMVLVGFDFHPTMVSWIMECVSNTSFSICINGDLYGFFKGKRGLRQGDPISLYLFTLVMEVLTFILQNKVEESVVFKYHKQCEKQQIINLCFVDDLFLFSYGNVNSATVLWEALEEFKEASGLIPSIPKSTIFFCNVINHVMMYILSMMPFVEGKIPVIYLGVPLISSRLLYKDCKILVENVQNRIGDWKNKSLAFAGILQLVQSVLSYIHLYWASVLILPA
ncbi:putative reverse transcriptase domain, reverse transcriptase zinc-binding domain protein, partial [Tanacetum coccineum]